MQESSFRSEQDGIVLAQVYEGMRVYDVVGKHIGTVKYVYLGELTMAADEYSHGWATSSSFDEGKDSLIQQFANALLLTEEVSDSWREQLMCYGFVRINSRGLLAADRYVMPEQIAGVTYNSVQLRVRRDELLSP